MSQEDEAPATEVENICPLTGLPVLSRPEWTGVRLDDGYEATFFFLGDSILVGRPSGRATMKGVRKLMAFTEEIQSRTFSPRRRYIRIVDLTSLEGISLRARKHFSDEMKKRLHTRCMIFCGVSTFFSLSVQLANRLHLLPYPLKITADYPEAARLALRLVSGNTDGLAPKDAAREETSLLTRVPSDSVPGTASSSVDTYVGDVLTYLKSLKWDEDGISSAPRFPADHPFRRVFESIDLIKQDLDSLFHSHQKAMVEIRRSHEGMWSRVAERTAALTATNESLRTKADAQDEIIDGMRRAAESLLEAVESLAGEPAAGGGEAAAGRHAETLAAIRKKGDRLRGLLRS